MFLNHNEDMTQNNSVWSCTSEICINIRHLNAISGFWLAPAVGYGQGNFSFFKKLGTTKIIVQNVQLSSFHFPEIQRCGAPLHAVQAKVSEGMMEDVEILTQHTCM